MGSKNFKTTSGYKILFLYGLLLEKERTKSEISELFKKNGIKITVSSINNHISSLIHNGIEIKIKKKGKQNLYFAPKPKKRLELTKKDLQNFKTIKKYVVSKKDFGLIRQVMRLFYKIALFIDDFNVRKEFIDFGYYSTLNQGLIIELEKLCKNKSVIEAEYIKPDNSITNMIMHVDSISIGNASDRLYLNCILSDDNKISHLPADKIFTIKKIIKEKAPINLFVKTVYYTVATKIYKEAQPDRNEKIIEQNEKYTKVEYIANDEFYLIQRLMGFQGELYYISDKEIKKTVIEKLKLVKALYET